MNVSGVFITMSVDEAVTLLDLTACIDDMSVAELIVVAELQRVLVDLGDSPAPTGLRVVGS